MLDTLLQIGKTLRESGRLRHHRYIKAAPKVEKTKTGGIKTDVVYLVLPVREDFTFDFDNLETDFHNENIIPDFYYLGYKSSDADSLVKYIWGDISYGIDKKGKEQGYYRMENPAITNAFGLSSFTRGIEDAKTFDGTLIEKFRQSFEANREQIENLLKENSKEKFCYLHFDFQGKHWYQFENELEIINNKFLFEFVGEKQHDSVVLRKYIYKTLAAPEKFGGYIPNFSESNIYKTRTFESNEQVLDLIYAINYSTKPVVRERDIKVIILPKGDNLEANHIEQFFERRRFEQEDNAEDLLTEQNKFENETDEFFLPIISDEVADSIVEFDFVFSKAGGGPSTPDVDLIELAGIKRSLLAELSTRIDAIRFNVQTDREKIVGKSDKIKPLSIKQSFLNILGDVTKDKKKYQSHLLKVLPQIYAGNYYEDRVLLAAFIEKTEYNIRNEKTNFNFLKFDYEFLVRLRNKNGDETMEEMKNSKSYKAGKLLGTLAQPVSWEIKSFEKNYVGLLSRRISDIQGLIGFANFINEKLAIHERAYPSLKEKYGELANLLGELNHREYHRDYCAFGFFEGYFAKFEKPENKEKTND